MYKNMWCVYSSKNRSLKSWGVIPAVTSPVPWGLSWVSVVLTLPAMRGSMVLGNPWFLSHSISLTRQRISRKLWGKNSPAALLRATPSRPGLPPTSPKQPANLDDSQPLRAPVSVCTSPPSVQQCPLPRATAFPHPQRFNANGRAATETPEHPALPHFGAPALASECTEMTPPGGHQRSQHIMTFKDWIQFIKILSRLLYVKKNVFVVI